jgi:hypothetical protein
LFVSLTIPLLHALFTSWLRFYRPSHSSLLSPLHLPERIKVSVFVNDYVLDVKKAGGVKELDLLDSSSCDDCSEAESVHDNLTERW